MYVKPLVLENGDFAEGVFAASGSTDCWDVSGRSVQDWNGSHNVFEIRAVHSTDVVHITTQVTYTIKFSAPLTDAYSEFSSTFSGDTVTVVRDLHANGYNSGDVVTFKVWAKAADEATTKALGISGISYVCRHETNVQGGID
ncbi:MAG: hypothetical protein IJT05_01695 [Lachnospiraceae bacterium]|nr:hypothetical protein [Lachnospiraceae bacterium]